MDRILPRVGDGLFLARPYLTQGSLKTAGRVPCRTKEWAGRTARFTIGHIAAKGVASYSRPLPSSWLSSRRWVL